MHFDLQMCYTPLTPLYPSLTPLKRGRSKGAVAVKELAEIVLMR
jgi:hypothetical protein